MSQLLVFMQFTLIALIAFPFSAPVITWYSAGLFCSGILLFVIAILTMPRSTFTIMPEPKEGGALVNHGVYRWVRHPMYSSVLLCALGASLAYDSFWKWIASAMVTAVLLIKSRREERYLLKQYANYADYKKHTWAICPYLY